MKKFVWIWILLFICALPVPTFAQETHKIEGEWINRPVNQYSVLQDKTVQNFATFATLTDPSMQQLTTDLEAAFVQRKTTFTIQYVGDTTDLGAKVDQAITSILSNNEYLNYDFRGYSYSGTSMSQSATLDFTASYYQTAQQVADVDQQIKQIFPEIINTNMNEREKVKAVHDYIITHVQYDTTLNQAVNAPYFALTQGKTLCNGYAMLFYQMLKELNIPVRLISGTAGADKIGHAWNLVQLDGQWYHLDATWDDPIPDVAGRTVYNYYLVSSEMISKDHYWKQGGLNGKEKPYPIDQIVVANVGTGSIAITVLNDDKKTPTNEPLHVKITDKNGTVMTSSTDTISVTDGTFTSSSTLAKGTYYVTISDGKINQTTKIKVSTRKVPVKLIWESTWTGLKDSKGAINKSGAITGIVYDSTANTATVVTDATVKIISNKTTWSTKTKKNGSFKVYVPAGTYDVIIEGKDSANVDDKKNMIYKKVKVTAGQAAAPLQQLNAGLSWESADKDLDFLFTESSLAGKDSKTASKAFTGKAIVDSLVSVYTVTAGNTTKTWVAETKTKKTGEFSVTVPILAGKQVIFIVQDEAGNTYESVIKQVPKIDAPILSASAVKGIATGTTAITVMKTKNTDNRILVIASNAATSTPKLGDAAPTTSNSAIACMDNYESKKDISVKGATYAAVYEVSAIGEIVRFKDVPLTGKIKE